MLDEIGLEGEGLLAAAALVVLLRRVRLEVCTQVGAVSERLAATGDRAAVWPFAGVRTRVAAKEPRPREMLAAYLASVPHFMC